MAIFLTLNNATNTMTAVMANRPWGCVPMDSYSTTTIQLLKNAIYHLASIVPNVPNFVSFRNCLISCFFLHFQLIRVYKTEKLKKIPRLFRITVEIVNIFIGSNYFCWLNWWLYFRGATTDSQLSTNARIFRPWGYKNMRRILLLRRRKIQHDKVSRWPGIFGKDWNLQLAGWGFEKRLRFSRTFQLHVPQSRRIRRCHTSSICWRRGLSIFLRLR